MLELRNKTDNGFANNTSATVNITNPQPQEIYIQKPLCEHVLASLNTFLNNPVNKVFFCIENSAATSEPTKGAKRAIYIYFSIVILSFVQYHLS